MGVLGIPRGWDGFVEGYSEHGNGDFSDDAGDLSMPTSLAGPESFTPLLPAATHASTLDAWGPTRFRLERDLSGFTPVERERGGELKPHGIGNNGM